MSCGGSVKARARPAAIVLAMDGKLGLAALLLVVGTVGSAVPRAGEDPGSPLKPGDVLVATRGPGASHGSSVVRFRSQGEGPALESRVLVQVAQVVRALSVSGDGRFVAVEVDGGAPGPRVLLYATAHAAVERSHLWESPPGCDSPALDVGRTLVLRCPEMGAPASLLRLDLRTWATMRLGGEWARGTPAFGPRGDLQWSEQRGDHNVVLRQSGGQAPIATHRLGDPIRALWPQEDGSSIAELEVPGSRRELVRLLASGAIRAESEPRSDVPAAGPRDPLTLNGAGTRHWVRCDNGLCTVSSVTADGALAFVLPAESSALAVVPEWGTQVGVREDLATAGPDVFAERAATDVDVLGVRIGTPLETAWSVLDRAERNPYWLPSGAPRGRPGGIGLGPAADGHCVEFLANDRGVVEVIVLRGCSLHWLSPALRPLLEEMSPRSRLVEAVSRALGPVVAVRTEGDAADGRPAPAEGVRRVHLWVEALDRGLRYRASSDVLMARPSQTLDGRITLELRAPSRAHAARP